jgi:ATP-binding cassette, subfamily C, bacterial CydC
MTPWIYLLRLYRPRASLLIVSYLCLTITWLAGAALLAVSGWFITACAMAGLGLILNLNIFTPSAAIRGLAILRTLGRYTERVIGHEAILRILADLRVRAFRAISSRPARVIDTRRYADVVGRLLSDVETLDGIPIRVIGPLFSAFLTLVGVIVVSAIWGNAMIATTIGLGGTLIFVVAWICALKGRAQSRQLVQARATQRVAVIDHLAGMAELIANNQDKNSSQRLNEIDHAQLLRVSKQEIVSSVGEHSVQALTLALTLLVLFLASGAVQAPILALLGLMTLGLNEALGTLPGALWRLGESEEAARRLQSLETSEAPAYRAIKSHIEPKTITEQLQTSIEIKDLMCQRQPNRQKSFSLTLLPGQPQIIYGKSGSGKTSLLDTLAGELDPLSGEVIAQGINLLSLPDGLRYQEIAFLGQSDQLINISIREFLSLGLTGVTDEKLKSVLAAVGLTKTLEETPENLNYMLGVRGNRISGGQARRLQLACLLLREPKLVLLDEPFRGLERPLVQSIIANITPWMANKCVLFVTHDPDAIPSHWPKTRWP